MKKYAKKIPRYMHSFCSFFKLSIVWSILHLFHRNLLTQNIWLICEKRNEARDNGYHFYRYLKKHHPEVNTYYVITPDSPDLHKVQCLGNVIFADTFKHVLYYLAAAKSISSQAYGAYPFGFNLKELKLVKSFCNPLQQTIFLQHGIIKDELSHQAFDYELANIDYFVCSAQKEYAFIKQKYGYPDRTIGCIGLCRFDNLHQATGLQEKILLVMPSWRMWLRRKKDGIPLTQKEIANFKNSIFYQQFAMLLSAPELLECLKANGYKLYFYLHYQLQDYSKVFSDLSSETVIIADRYHYDVQDLLMRAGILVTDYSSVQFDFAYMNKPIVYFQFDKAQFEGEHYAKGYFRYNEDGFGPCCEDLDSINLILQNLIATNAAQPALFQKRVDVFFNIRDDQNCKRTFDVVSNL